MRVLGLLAVTVLTILASEAIAEDKPVPRASPVSKKRAKGKRTREKETEGSQAPNRFEAGTVLKSRYELDGRPLEVDPD